MQTDPGMNDRPHRRTDDGSLFWLAGATAVVLAVAALLAALWYLRTALLIIFAGFLFAVLLDALVRGLVRITHIPRPVAVPAVAFTIAALAGIALWHFGPVLAEQISQLAGNVADALANVARLLRRDPEAEQAVSQIDFEQFLGWLPSPWGIASGANAILNVVLGTLATILIIGFFGLYFAYEPDLYERGLLRFFSSGTRPAAQRLFRDIVHTLRRWLVGKAITMLAIALFTYIGLLVLGIELALVLALFAGLAAFVPYIGPIIGAVPILLVAFGQSLALLAWVAGLYLAVQFLESYVLTPLVQSRAVAIAPAVVIAAQLVLGTTFGILGVALATPLVAAAAVAYRSFTNGEQTRDPHWQEVRRQ